MPPTPLRILLLCLALVLAGCGKKPSASPPASSPAPATTTTPSEKPAPSASSEEDANETKAFELYVKWQKAFEFKVTAAEERAGQGQGGDFRGLSHERAVEVTGQVINQVQAITEEVKRQPKEVEELFWAIVGGKGLLAPVLSADGSRVAFQYTGTHYDPADTDPHPDIYLWNLADGTIKCVSKPATPDPSKPPPKWGRTDPAISRDASVVAYCSAGEGFGMEMPAEQYNICIRDLAVGGDAALVADNPEWSPEGEFKLPTGIGRFMKHPSLSADGNRLAFIAAVASSRAIEDVVGPTYEALVVLDRATKKYRALSQKANRLGKPAIAGNGSVVAVVASPSAFLPDDKDYATCFLWLVPTDGSAPIRLPNPEGVTFYFEDVPSLSADGNRIAITGRGADLKPQVFVYDRATSQWTLASAGPSGKPGAEGSATPSLSSDGSAVVFISSADDLMPGGKTLGMQTYRYDVATKQLSVMTLDSAGKPMQGVSSLPSLNADGTLVAALIHARELPGVRLPKRQGTGILMRLYVLDTKAKRFVPLGKPRAP